MPIKSKMYFVYVLKLKLRALAFKVITVFFEVIPVWTINFKDLGSNLLHFNEDKEQELNPGL